jgi:hypothetical protein
VGSLNGWIRLNMATQGLGTMMIPRSERRGSIALVLLVAVMPPPV